MEIRLRCSECDRDVLVDEAFAGGVCRCPHCKATLSVPERPAGRSGNRPAQPARAEAPLRATTVRRGKSARSAQQMNRIVMVMLLGITAVFLATGVVLIQRHLSEPATGNPEGPAAPSTRGAASRPSGPRVADVALEGNVVYVLDGGSSMRDVYNYAVLLTLRSIGTLQPPQQYAVIVSREQLPLVMEGGYQDPGPEAEEFLLETLPTGATDIPAALSAAADMQPDVVVLMARKPLEDPAGAARPLVDAGVRLVTIAMDADSSAAASLAEAAGATGGETRSYNRSDLDGWASGGR
ncbi:MAG: hypothetical protein ACP5HU_10475 [Phycisphaerae bacterium]